MKEMGLYLALVNMTKSRSPRLIFSLPRLFAGTFAPVKARPVARIKFFRVSGVNCNEFDFIRKILKHGYILR